jgi:hypothetical protein
VLRTVASCPITTVGAIPVIHVAVPTVVSSRILAHAVPHILVSIGVVVTRALWAAVIAVGLIVASVVSATKPASAVRGIRSSSFTGIVFKSQKPVRNSLNHANQIVTIS